MHLQQLKLSIVSRAGYLSPLLLWFSLLLAGIVLGLVAPGVAHADSLERAIRIHHAKTLFDTMRFRDAELEFAILRKQHLPIRPGNLDSYIDVLDFLARSISQQGKTEQVLTLLQERHVLVAQHYHSKGFVFAGSMGRLAEALYREGNRSGALSFIDYAISLYRDLRPTPTNVISLAQSNRLQYKIAKFNVAMLPMDLSDFYTRCELINSSDSTRNIAKLMSKFVEVGVDYLPEGAWSDYFDVKLQQHYSISGGHEKHRIFLPHSSEPMRKDLCFVTETADEIISAGSDPD